MRANMRVDMRLDMCIDMCVDMCVGVRLKGCVDAPVETWIDGVCSGQCNKFHAQTTRPFFDGTRRSRAQAVIMVEDLFWEFGNRYWVVIPRVIFRARSISPVWESLV